MNPPLSGRLRCCWVSRSGQLPSRARIVLRPGIFQATVLLVFLLVGSAPAPSLGQGQPASAQDPNTNSASSGTKEEQLAALQLEMTNAFGRVLAIVNRPVQAYARPARGSVSISSPGWFHAGARKPDFNTVDVRQTQELVYAKDKYVTSDLNPGIVFLGQDLEFNAMTKYFYTNRSVPKRRLTEAEMLEINQLYRIIGRCESEITRLQSPADDASSADATDNSASSSTAGGSFDSLRSIPRQTRLLYGGTAIAALLGFVFVLRILRRARG